MSTSTSAARCSAGSVASAARTARRRSAATAASAGSGAAPVAAVEPAAAVVVEVVGQRLGAAYLRRAQPVEAGVDDDPVQPGGDRGVAAEGAGPAVRRDQAVLQPVGGVLGVAHGAQRDRPEPVAVPGEEHAEGVGVAVDVGGAAARRRCGASGLTSAPPRCDSSADRDLGDLAAEAAAVPGSEVSQTTT